MAAPTFPALPGGAWPGQITPGDPGPPTGSSGGGAVFPRVPLDLECDLLLGTTLTTSTTPSTLVGATVPLSALQSGAYYAGLTKQQGDAAFVAAVNRGLNVPSGYLQVTKLFWNQPGVGGNQWTLGTYNSLAYYQAAGTRVVICVFPTFNAGSTSGPHGGNGTSGDLTNLTNFLAGLTALGFSAANCDIVLWQEPANTGNSLSASDYGLMIKSYGPAVNAAGFPLIINVNYAGSLTPAANNAVEYAQAALATSVTFSAIRLDYYTNHYFGGTLLTSTGAGGYSIMSLADAYGLTFGLNEWGSNPYTYSITQCNDYHGYLLTTFAARAAAGKPPDVLIYYDGVSTANGSGQIAAPLLSPSYRASFGLTPSTDPRISATPLPAAGYQQVFDGLTAAVTTETAGAAWTDVSSYVYQREGTSPPVTLTRGRADESTQAQPQNAAFTLNNRGGTFSEYNPTGPYYGQISRNTPVRFSIPDQYAGLRMEDDQVSYAATGAIAPPPFNLEARIDLNLSGWVSSVLASQWAVGGFCWAWLLNGDGTLSFMWTLDGATEQLATSSQPLPWPGGRVSLRVTYAESTGLVSFYYSPSISTAPLSWVQLGSPVASEFGGSGPIYAGTSPVQVGANSYFVTSITGVLGTFGAPAGRAWAPAGFTGMTGKVFEFRLYKGIAGPYLADAVFSAQAPGTTSFIDAQGNTWALAGTATIDGRNYRYHGALAALPQRWDPTGADVWIPVTASGPLRQAGSGSGGQGTTPPLQSAMTRGWALNTANPPVGYWPAEDGTGATQIASGLPGGPPLAFSSLVQPQLASNTDFACSGAIPSLNKSTWWANIPAYTPAASPAIITRFLFEAPQGGDTDQGVIVRVHTTGTVYRLEVQYSTADNGSLQIEAFDGNGNSLFASGFLNFTSDFGGVNGVPLEISAELTTSGSHVEWGLWVLQPATSGAIALGASGSVSGTVGIATSLGVNPKLNALLNGSCAGQISVQPMWESLYSGPMAGPLNAWTGETAGLRVARLCAEQGYGVRIAGSPSATVQMGAQTQQTFIDLLGECETADGGMIAEARDSLSIRYRTLASMCGQDPLALSYTGAQFGTGTLDIEPTDDDQLIVNDVIVTRQAGDITGSSYQLQVTEGPMSILPPQQGGVGDYQQQAEVNVMNDSQLPDAAGWITHEGTVNEPRYPQIPVDLSRTELAAAFYEVLGLDLGDYLQMPDPPVWLGPDAVKMALWQSKEELGGFFLRQTFATLPESPYEVLFAGTGALTDCRADTDGSSLQVAVSATATSLLVATPDVEDLWSTTAADYPVDVVMAGERITVTGVTGTTSPQAFTVVRSVNDVVKAQAAGAAVTLFQPSYLALV